MRRGLASVGAAVLLLALARPGEPAPATAPGAAAPRSASTTCVQDDPVPTPPGYAGWDRSSVIAWEAIEMQGGIVPDIDEDRTQAPPAWWRYPSPLRSAALLAAEAKNPKGLYTAVAEGDLKAGDLVVRVRGAGACGKMAVIAGHSDDGWVTIQPQGQPQGDDNPATPSADAIFFDGKTLRPETAAYRLAVKKDSSLGHVREIDRDVRHLERTIAERPPLIARKGQGARAAVDEKVHDLVDESWSLIADTAFDEDRRALTGRVLALAAALDWPGALEASVAVLDDALARKPARADATIARASVMLLAGEPAKAATLAEGVVPHVELAPRTNYVLGRALLASGKQAEGLEAMRRYLDGEPGDPRAQRLSASAGRDPALVTAGASVEDGPATALRFSATADKVTMHSQAYGMDASWPVTWRIVNHAAAPATGLLLEFATERVLREDGEAERGTAVLLAQRPAAGEAAALAKKGARNMFPEAKLKTLSPLVPGTRREQFRERQSGSSRQGEVTTLQRGDTVYFLVLNASTASYPKLKDEYATFVKNLVVK
jgi:hypothetical protein